jgi:hypothetical protein
MCLPSPYRSKGSPNESTPESETLGSGMVDLESTREEVVNEVLKAPFRRVDNEIQRLTDSLHVLHMHCKVIDELVKRYRRLRWSCRGTQFAAAVLAGGLSTTTILTLPIEISAGISCVSTLACAGIFWFQNKALEDEAKTLASEGSIQSVFRNLYAKSLAENDEFIASIWPRVYQHISITVSPTDLGSIPRVSSSEYKVIEKILDVEIAKLRKRILPKF